jgi:hypothetical protein
MSRSVYVTHLGGISDTHGSDLEKIRLGSAGELYPVSRIGGLPKNHPTTIDPCCRHCLRNFVTEAGKAFEYSPSALFSRHRANLCLDEKVGAFDKFGVAAAR